jgi:hypothetical protein
MMLWLTGWTTNPSDRVMLAFSSESDIQLLLPSTNDNTSLLNIVAYISDTYNCVTEFNMSSVLVEQDLSAIDSLQNSTNSALIQMLSSGNQNRISQVITAISQQLNQINNQAIETTVASKCIYHHICTL